MKLSINEIKEMAVSCVRRLLNEISTSDAYQRFYSEKIPADIWNILMNGVANMTPFHKAIVDSMINLCPEGPSNKNSLATMKLIAELASQAWNKSIKGQQFLNNIAKEGYEIFENINKLLDFLRQFNDKKLFSENEYIDSGLVKLYEDDKWYVTCTTTYSASKKHYGDTHWCTASDIFGQFNGFKMFKNYLLDYEPGILVQFVNKENRENTYQAWVIGSGDFPTICDFFDREITIDRLKGIINDEMNPRRFANIKRIISSKFSTLQSQTLNGVKEEEHYWNFKLSSFLKKSIVKINTVINSQEVVDYIVANIKENKGLAFKTPSFSVRASEVLGCGALYTVIVRGNIEEGEKSYFNSNTQKAIDVIRNTGGRTARTLRKFYLMDRNYNLIKIFPGDFIPGGHIGNFFVFEDRDEGMVRQVINGKTGEVILSLKTDRDWEAYMYWDSFTIGFNGRRVYNIDLQTGEVTSNNKNFPVTR